MREENEAYEDKLYDEILVDCKDIYEQNMSWYYYAQDEMRFPFMAKIELEKKNGQKERKEVEVLRLSKGPSSFEESFDLSVDIELGEFIIGVPLRNLEDVQGSEQLVELIEIWKYWRKG